MGSILAIDCLDCDYATEVYEGTGVLGIEQTPMECRRCKQAVSVTTCANREAPEALGLAIELGRCESCDGDDLQALTWFADKHGRLVECPRCRGRAAVENAGIWD